MKVLRLAAATAALLVSFGAGAFAQTTLRIGIAEDPDILDPSLGRSGAELSVDEKNRISHRGQAMARLLERLRARLQHQEFR